MSENVNYDNYYTGQSEEDVEDFESEEDTIYCQYCQKGFIDFDEWKAHEEEEAKSLVDMGGAESELSGFNDNAVVSNDDFEDENLAVDEWKINEADEAKNENLSSAQVDFDEEWEADNSENNLDLSNADFYEDGEGEESYENGDNINENLAEDEWKINEDNLEEAKEAEVDAFIDKWKVQDRDATKTVPQTDFADANKDDHDNFALGETDFDTRMGNENEDNIDEWKVNEDDEAGSVNESEITIDANLEGSQTNFTDQTKYEEKIYCQHCEKEFTDFDEWKLHEEEEAKSLMEGSKQNVTNIENVLAEVKTPTNNIIHCQHCEKPFTDFNEWKLHEEEEGKMMELKHQSEEENKLVQSNYSNLEIKKLATPETPVNKRTMSTEVTEGEPVMKKIKTNPFQFHCKQCPNTYENKEAMQRHMRYHATGGDPHILSEQQIQVLTTYYNKSKVPTNDMVFEISQVLNLDSHAYIQNWFKTKMDSSPKKIERRMSTSIPKGVSISRISTSIPNGISVSRIPTFLPNAISVSRIPDSIPKSISPVERTVAPENQEKSNYVSRTYSSEQVDILWKYFNHLEASNEKKLRYTVRDEIAKAASMTPNAVTSWFSYQRKRKTTTNKPQTLPRNSEMDQKILVQNTQKRSSEMEEKIRKHTALENQLSSLLQQVEMLKKDVDASRKSLDERISLNDSGYDEKRNTSMEDDRQYTMNNTPNQNNQGSIQNAPPNQQFPTGMQGAPAPNGMYPNMPMNHPNMPFNPNMHANQNMPFNPNSHPGMPYNPMFYNHPMYYNGFYGNASPQFPQNPNNFNQMPFNGAMADHQNPQSNLAPSEVKSEPVYTS